MCIRDRVLALHIAAGADVQCKNSLTWTPLLEACHRGFLSIVKVLLTAPRQNLSYIPEGEASGPARRDAACGARSLQNRAALILLLDALRFPLRARKLGTRARKTRRRARSRSRGRRRRARSARRAGAGSTRWPRRCSPRARTRTSRIRSGGRRCTRRRFTTTSSSCRRARAVPHTLINRDMRTFMICARSLSLIHI